MTTTSTAERILHDYGVDPDLLAECREKIVAATIKAHIPSITEEMDAGEGKWGTEDTFLYPRDDEGNYIGDKRVCACGVELDGFYEYVDHLIAVFGGVE